jgi:hypothetical protein
LDYKISTPVICDDYKKKWKLPEDRVGTYHSIHVANIPEGFRFKTLQSVDEHKRSIYKDVITLRHMYLLHAPPEVGEKISVKEPVL